MGSLTKNNIIKVLAASDHPLMRRGIVSSLDNEADIVVVCQASCRFEIMDCIYNKRPHVLVIDATSKTGTNYLETIQLIHKKHPNSKVLLVVDTHDDNKELAALKMGVNGILSDWADKTEFVTCIRSLSAGKLWIRREILEKFIIGLSPALDYAEDADQKQHFPSLTKRELDIMKLVVRDYKNKEIGESLFISEKTVKNHLSNIFKKFHVKKRVDLKKYLLHSDL